MLARGFDHYHVRHRSDDCQVSSKGRGKREHFPHQLGLGKPRDPLPATRTISWALARHVDFAAAANKIDNQTRCSHLDLSLYTSPHHACRIQTSRASGDIFESNLV